MSQTTMVKVGKKGAIYIPKRIMKKLGIKEGDKALLKIRKNRIILEFIPDPFSLALKMRKWAKTTVEEFEYESESDQAKIYEI